MRLFLPLACVTALAAQGGYVSPLDYFAAFPGNADRPRPFTAPNERFQQIHNDLRQRVMVIRSLALRRPSIDNLPLGFARNADMQITMGGGLVAQATTAFAANHLVSPQTPFLRKVVRLPNRIGSPPSVPAPFDAVFPFDQPFAHSGALDLVWDLVVFANDGIDPYYSDYAGPATRIGARSSAIGQGCVTSAMGLVHQQPVIDVDAGSGALRMAWTTRGALANASLAVTLVGATNPGLTVPGLCGSGRLFTSAEVVLVGGPADANGTFATPAFAVPWLPAFGGATLYSQSLRNDAGQPGLPLVATSGMASRLPPGPPPAWTIVFFAADQASATTATITSTTVPIVRFGS